MYNVAKCCNSVNHVPYWVLSKDLQENYVKILLDFRKLIWVYENDLCCPCSVATTK